MGERLLRELQLQAQRRVPKWRDLLLDERAARAGRALACPLQHHKATFFAGLSIAGTRGMADKQHGLARLFDQLHSDDTVAVWKLDGWLAPPATCLKLPSI